MASFNEEELLKIERATSGFFKGKARSMIGAALRDLQPKVEATKRLQGEARSEALKTLANQATESRPLLTSGAGLISGVMAEPLTSLTVWADPDSGREAVIGVKPSGEGFAALSDGAGNWSFGIDGIVMPADLRENFSAVTGKEAERISQSALAAASSA
jgi:hypothetical protein